MIHPVNFQVYNQEKKKAYVYTKTCTQMFIAAVQKYKCP
jgi:hypothetical protein